MVEIKDKRKEMKNTYTNEIAAHECGQWFALAASGLAGEFTSATVVPQTSDAERSKDDYRQLLPRFKDWHGSKRTY